ALRHAGLRPRLATVLRALAAPAHPGQPAAGRRRLRAAAGHHRVPGAEPRRAAGRGREDRRDHHLRTSPAPRVRPAPDPLGSAARPARTGPMSSPRRCVFNHVPHQVRRHQSCCWRTRTPSSTEPAGRSVAPSRRPFVTGITANFITARAAARHMTEQGSGVILALDSGSAHGSPMMGGTGPADAATDTFVRNLAAEVGPCGVRVVGLSTAGVPETLSPAKLAAVNSSLVLDDAAFEGLLDRLAEMRMLRRSPRLADVAATAAFLASDRAAAITGTFVNVTSGIFPS